MRLQLSNLFVVIGRPDAFCLASAIKACARFNFGVTEKKYCISSLHSVANGLSYLSCMSIIKIILPQGTFPLFAKNQSPR
jgi:hypothetical protein